MVAGEQVLLGYFGDKEKAARRYDINAEPLGRALNFPKHKAYEEAASVEHPSSKEKKKRQGAAAAVPVPTRGPVADSDEDDDLTLFELHRRSRVEVLPPGASAPAASSSSFSASSSSPLSVRSAVIAAAVSAALLAMEGAPKESARRALEDNSPEAEVEVGEVNDPLGAEEAEEKAGTVIDPLGAI